MTEAAESANRWERFSKEAPESYILTGFESMGDSPDERRHHFFASGDEEVSKSLASVQQWNHGWDRALEIGCGIGRLTMPLARRFAEVRAVDVAPTMLARLRENAADTGLANIRGFLPTEPWDNNGGVDYAYSFLVFQHIEDLAVIDDYLMRIGRALLPNGVAQLQFDTRPRTAAYRARALLPDLVLPRSQRRGIRRIRRSPVELFDMVHRAGLVVADQSGLGGAQHTLVLRRVAQRRPV
ncbi:MAG: class I SAM-dependent methyltransferase [Actinomycetota bacterium]|nr:class I SAM-dependent methyltransferase [Actinomycetota bacterium]